MSDENVKDRLEYLERLLASAERQNLIRVAQFIRAAIYGIEFAVEALSPSCGGSSDVIQDEGHLYLIIGGTKYPVELDETLSPGEWHLKGRPNI